MLDDLLALVEFAHAVSMAGARDRLFRAPSSTTRQVQRLEAALGAELILGGAEISYIGRRRTSRPLAHRAHACPGRRVACRTHSGAD